MLIIDRNNKVYFDDIDLTRFIDIRNISTDLAAPVTTSYQVFDRVSGGRFDYSSFGQIVVTIKFSIRNNTLSVLDDLNRILHTKEEKVLYFEDRPDRYLMAMYTGETNMNRRYYGSTSTLTFISSKPYWYSTAGEKIYTMDSENKFLVSNHGTAPTVPKFEFLFPAENGFLSIISPNGYIALGDKEELDRVDLPKQELVMNEEMHSEAMSDNEKDWFKVVKDDYIIDITLNDGTVERITGIYVPDYNKLSIGTGNISHTEYGMTIGKSMNPKAGHYWNARGYKRIVDKGVDDSTFSIKTNWRLESRLTFYNASGKLNDTGMYLIVVFDMWMRPIMTTSVYNILDNSNEVTFTAKINDRNGNSKSSKIVKTAKFPNGFDGLIKMETSPNGHIYWSWNSNRDQKKSMIVDMQEKFNVGNVAYIRNNAKYGYHHDGTQYNIASFTRGKPYNLTQRRVHNGKTQFLIKNFSGVTEYWMNEEDLTANKSGVGKTSTRYTADAEKNVNYSLYAPEISNMKAHSVLVLGGTWDDTTAFSNASLNSVKMFILNGENNWLEINNVFQPKDLLTIDNQTGKVLLNGAPFDGLIDYDSKFFDLDYGNTELQVVTSSWAPDPQGKISFEERFR